jgi:dicarboxylate/amino acid:cation (Na+ or H+) symporter, DAACS family
MSTATRTISLPTKIVGGLVLGAIAGGTAQAILGAKDPNLASFVENVAKPAGSIFLYLIFMVVVPLLFSALVIGIGEVGGAAKVGKIGALALGMTLLLSGIAVFIGYGAVNLAQPGNLISAERKAQLIKEYSSKTEADKNLKTAQTAPEDPPLLGFIPKNPFKEINRALEGGLLPLMFFALMFGLAMSQIEPEKALPLRQFFDSLFAVSQRIIEMAMTLAPYGVFFLVFRTAATLGLELIQALSVYVAVVLGALALHQFVTYPIVIRLIAQRDPIEFFRKLKTVMLTAFATSSSNATLPVALRSAEEDLGLPRRISNFVLTVGATANQNGTALFEGITILFLCQLFGVALSTGQQFTVLGLAIVAGVGTAGVPGGAWPMIATILVMFKVPAEAIGIVFGIDRILDMCRTVLNVTGDITIAACVARLAGDNDASSIPEEALA